MHIGKYWHVYQNKIPETNEHSCFAEERPCSDAAVHHSQHRLNSQANTMSLDVPSRGFSFPHVGNGDATTVAVKEDEVYVQVDLNHLQDAEDDEDPHVPVIDELKEILPEGNDGKPYLSLFVLTHPDQDHCRGFERLQEEFTIGEIIHTPRIFREYEDDNSLCDDAEAFREEADRRRKATIKASGDPGKGDRVRIVGYDDIFEEERYEDFPEEYRHSAGNPPITEVDGEELEVYEMFVHAPLHDEHDGERNDSSFAFQIVLECEAGTQLKGLFFGDRAADKIWRVVEETRKHNNEEEGRLDWNVLLASHHCSKYALFEKNDDDEVEPHDDLIEALDEGALVDEGAWVVASCEAVDDDGNSAFTDDENDDPPHKKARWRYESMVDSVNDFRCTGEDPDTDAPEPVTFEVDDDGIHVEPAGGSSDDNSGSAEEAFGAAAVTGGSSPSRKTIDHGTAK